MHYPGNSKFPMLNTNTQFLTRIRAFVILLLGLGGVAFITLLERKLLSLRQLRLGPNKVTIRGLLQPLRDGVKLLFKRRAMPYLNQNSIYSIFPLGLFLFFLTLWGIVIPWGIILSLTSALILLAVLGIGTYLVIITGWRPTRIFSKLGSLRRMLQGLSFEVALVLIFLRQCLSYQRLSLCKLRFKEEVSLVWIILWVFLILIDTNRAPFDLLEGESELIRGFNIEMRSILFVFIFLREYGMIIISSLLGRITISMTLLKFSIVLIVTFLIIRSCYPRIRYDLIRGIIWKRILSIGLVIFIEYNIFN